MNAYLVEPSDRRVEELLHACGIRTMVTSETDLGALASADTHPPDVIVLDLRNRTAVPAAVASMKRQHPSTGVLIVASRLEPSLMLEAMRAGVTEFLTEPLSAQELKAALDRVVAGRPAPDPGQVMAFVGGKGGIGTTTLAVNVATILAQKRQQSVLLIDLHIAYGDAALFLGVEPRFSVADAIENLERIDEAFLRSLVAHTKPGVDVLASSDRALLGHVEARAIRTLIDCAARHYRQVILDVPRSDSAMLDALELANPIVVVANQELSTVRSAARMAAALRQRYGKGRVNVVVSRYDEHAEIGRKDIELVIGGPIAETFPSNYRLAIDALNSGRPLVLDNHNKLAHSFARFARALAGHSAGSPPEKPAGIFGRLSGRT